MVRFVGYAAGVLAVAACSTGNQTVAPQPRAAAPNRASGVETRYIDEAVRPQDDLYRHLNGKWLDTFQLPADKGSFGSFNVIDDQTQEQLRAIVEGLAKVAATGGATQAGATQADAADADARKLADLYASFMDEARLETLGLAPLQAQFAAIDALADKRDIAALIARFNRTGPGAPYDIDIDPDAKDSTRYAVVVSQSGLGLPDRDYYLKDDAKFKDIRAKYLAHIERMFDLARTSGMPAGADSHQSAADILKLETALAALQWTRVENRDPEKTYNKVAIANLDALMPGYDWRRYLETVRHCRQDGLSHHPPAELFQRACEGAGGHPAGGLEKLFPVASAYIRRPVPVEGLRRRAVCLHRHRAARHTGEPPALEARPGAAERFDGRGHRQAVRG